MRRLSLCAAFSFCVLAGASSTAVSQAGSSGGQGNDRSSAPIILLDTKPASGAARPSAATTFSLPGFRGQTLQEPVLKDAADEAELQEAWLRSFGMVSLQSLTERSGKGRILALQMIDPPGAYGLLTLASPPGELLPIGDGARVAADKLMFWKGNYFFLARGADEAILRKWADSLARQVAESGALPTVVELLPRQGLDAKTIQFFVKDLIPADGRLGEMRPMLGVEKSVQATIGRYASGEGRLIILGYPTHALALEGFEKVKAYVTDKSHGVWAKRAGVILALTEGMPKEQALALLETVHYTPTVKWLVDKQTPRPRGGGVRFLLDTVVASIVFSFVFVFVTGMLGVLLGGGRVWLRRFRPNNYLDRPERVAMIRLKLVDK